MHVSVGPYRRSNLILSNCGAGEDSLSPLDCKEIKSVNPEGNQTWIFIGRTETEAETPILWPPDAKTGFTGKDPDAGKDWGQEEKGVIEDEMIEWHHLLNGYEFEQTRGDSEGQGSLACCSPWVHKESDMTKRLNNIKLAWIDSHSMQISNPCFKVQKGLTFKHTEFIHIKMVNLRLYLSSLNIKGLWLPYLSPKTLLLWFLGYFLNPYI